MKLKLRTPFIMNFVFVLLVCFGTVRAQQPSSPSSLSEQSKQYLDRLNKLLGPVPTRKGPVLFPPSPPDPPANTAATSKPDTESVNTFQQNYFARLTHYKPVTLATLTPETLAPRIGSVDDYVYDQAPYTDIEKKSIGNNFDSNYNQFETRTALPPIYHALAQNAQLTTQRPYPVYDHQSKIHVNENNYNGDISEEGKNTENEKDKSYAFSYKVKDQKTGDDFSHSQQSSGSATNGEYRVKLPDGRTQVVSYTADENGYKADVRYDTDNPNSIVYNFDSRNNNKDYNYNAPIYTKINDYQTPSKLDYKDVSKEYYNDFSAEYNNYEPHQSKFAIQFDRNKNDALKDLNQYLTSTVKPNYLELEDVLSKALPNVQPTFNYYPKETTENIVLIGNRNNFKSNPSDLSFINSTPRNYLVSTIASLRDRVTSKPILSDSFIKRINKYLSFN